MGLRLTETSTGCGCGPLCPAAASAKADVLERSDEYMRRRTCQSFKAVNSKKLPPVLSRSEKLAKSLLLVADLFRWSIGRRRGRHARCSPSGRHCTWSARALRRCSSWPTLNPVIPCDNLKGPAEELHAEEYQLLQAGQFLA
jgi:hypothetical protein